MPSEPLWQEPTFKPAGPADDADLRRLFAQNEMPGEIAVSFRREPSFFHASAVQGPFHQVFLARNMATGEAVGVASRATRPGYLNGRVEEVGYLSDLRIDPRYRDLSLLLRAFRYLRDLHADGRARLYFTVIADGNEAAKRVLTTGRWGLPAYRDLGRFLSPAVNLLRRKPEIPGVEIRRGSAEWLPGIVDCLNRNHQRRQFAPHYRIEDFQGLPDNPRFRGLRPEDFYLAVRGEEVVGVTARWDQGGYKQTVVTSYRGRVAALRPAYNLLAPLLGLPRFPKPGEPLRSFYAALVAVDGDDLTVFRALLRRLYNDHVGSGYAYFLAGLHERDPLAAALQDYTLTPFAGRLYAVHQPEDESAFASLDNRPPYVELAAL